MLDKRAVTWQTPGYPGWPAIPAGGSWRDQFVAYYAVILPRTIGFSVGYNF
jgi:hypothetical protein